MEKEKEERDRPDNAVKSLYTWSYNCLDTGNATATTTATATAAAAAAATAAVRSQ